jgi:transcriptional regulator with XRE-family HTH domain
MRSAPEMIRNARIRAGLSQRDLARALDTTQSAVARLESRTANPRLATLERALSACGRELTISSRPRRSSIDETQVAELLKVPAGERIKAFERSYANLREFALAAAESRGKLA